MIDDRDLMRLEPSLFTDAISVATLLIDTGDGIVNDSSLTSAGSDFVKMEIGAGHVAIVAGAVSEVVARVSSTELTVSLPRSSAEDPLIGLTPGSELSVKLPTFQRQIDAAQAWLLGALGLDASDPVTNLDETAILNVDELKRLLIQETIARVFRIAASLNPTDQALSAREAMYVDEVTAARHRTRAVLDLDGDGIADATRRVNVIVLDRI